MRYPSWANHVTMDTNSRFRSWEITEQYGTDTLPIS